MKTSLFELISLLLAITAIVAWLNARIVRLPGGIGITVAALCSSLIAMVIGHHYPAASTYAAKIVASFNFKETLFHGLLAFLLFAGALHVDVSKMAKQKWSIIRLSTIAVALSTFAFGALIHYSSKLLGIELGWAPSLLFGALISPTDPITALAMLKKAEVDPRLEAKIAGESLFNDGAALVIFSTILPFAINESTPTPNAASIGWDLIEEIAGGALVGISFGALAYFLIKKIDDYTTEILITLALAAGSWVVAEHIGVSAPISTVCAGIFVVLGAPQALSKTTQEHLFPFWGLVDNILNTILFTFIGLELILIPVTSQALALAAFAIPVSILARLFSVWLPLRVLHPFGKFPQRTVSILTWGGMRGAISIAMALSLPKFPGRETIIVATYAVVVFSIVVQGLSLPKFAKWAYKAEDSSDKDTPSAPEASN